jgi:hypothetical protein
MHRMPIPIGSYGVRSRLRSWRWSASTRSSSSVPDAGTTSPFGRHEWPASTGTRLSTVGSLAGRPAHTKKTRSSSRSSFRARDRRTSWPPTLRAESTSVREAGRRDQPPSASNRRRSAVMGVVHLSVVAQENRPLRNAVRSFLVLAVLFFVLIFATSGNWGDAAMSATFAPLGLVITAWGWGRFRSRPSDG